MGPLTFRPRVGIIHYRPKTTSVESFEVGFRAATELLQGNIFNFTWINLDDWEGKTVESLDLDSLVRHFDILWVKSNWDWTVDRFCRTYLGSVRNAIPMVLFISGVAKPPASEAEVQFYDFLFYETDWYLPQIERRHPLVHKAMGIDTRVMRPIKGMRKSIGCLYIGWMAFYKRPELFARHLELQRVKAQKLGQTVLPLVAVGKLDGAPESETVIANFRKRGVQVRDAVGYHELAAMINQAEEVHIPARVDGGGERAVLESKSCGVPVRVEPDNPKLLELLHGPVLSHIHYAREISKGMTKLMLVGRLRGNPLMISVNGTHGVKPWLGIAIKVSIALKLG